MVKTIAVEDFTAVSVMAETKTKKKFKILKEKICEINLFTFIFPPGNRPVPSAVELQLVGQAANGHWFRLPPAYMQSSRLYFPR